MTKKEMSRLLLNFKIKKYLSDGDSLTKYDTCGEIESIITKIVDENG